jgi:hypothetical protein
MKIGLAKSSCSERLAPYELWDLHSKGAGLVYKTAFGRKIFEIFHS